MSETDKDFPVMQFTIIIERGRRFTKLRLNRFAFDEDLVKFI